VVWVILERRNLTEIIEREGNKAFIMQTSERIFFQSAMIHR